MRGCLCTIVGTACTMLAASGASAGPIPSEVRLETFFYPGTSRLLCNIGFEGYKKASQVAQARVVVFAPDDAVVARFTATDFEDETAAPFLPLPRDLKTGDYRVEVSLHDRAGRRLAGPARDTFRKKSFPFEGNTLGISHKVLPPWTPLKLDARRGQVDCWGREHTLKGDGLFEQVRTQGRPLLSRPTAWLAVAGGKTLPWETGKLQFTTIRDDTIEVAGQAACDKVAIRSRLHIEYDGMFKYDVELLPRGDGALDRLDLVVPLAAEAATLLHATSDGIRTNYAGVVPPGEGRVWDSSRVQPLVLTGTFLPYVWLGTERLGLCWWADSDQGWVRPAGKKEPVVEVIRQGKEVQLVFHVIGRPHVLKGPRRLVFAFEATPVRARPSWARTINVSYGGRMPGPTYEWSGSTSWCLKGTDRYKGWLYTPAHILPVDDDCAADLRRRTRKSHEEGRKAFVYTNLASRSFARQEVKYYSWEWRAGGEAAARSAVAKARPYDSLRVNYARSRVDFDVWALNEAMKMGVDAFFFDDMQAVGQRNLGAGLGYAREDGSVAGECSLFALRDYLKRVYTLLLERGEREPLLAMHSTTTLYAGPLAFSTLCIGYEHDNSRPDRRQLLLYGLPYLRAETACLQYGFVGSAVPRELFAERSADPRDWRNYLGTQLLHDMRISFDDIPGRKEVEAVLSRFGVGERECEFVGYWEAGKLYECRPADVKVSVYHRPSTKQALLMVVNLTNQAQALRWKPTARFGAIGALTDTLSPDRKLKADDAGFWNVPLEAYDFRLLQTGASGQSWWPSRPWLAEK